MKTNKKYLYLLFLIMSSNIGFATPSIEDGKALFTTRCTSCHNVNKQVTGPALAGVADRHSLDWIVNFVLSSQTLVNKGDTTAVALFNKYNKITMPDQKDLSAADVQNILAYIKLETKVGGAEKLPFTKPGKRQLGYLPVNVKDNYVLLIAYLGVVSLLIGALYFAVSVTSYRQMMLAK
jgi:cytochrome c2